MYTISVFRPDLCTHLDYRAEKTGVVEVLFFMIEFFKTKQVSSILRIVVVILLHSLTRFVKLSDSLPLRLIKAWVKNDFRLQCPPRKVRGIRVDFASNHSYLESRSCSS